MHGQDRASGDRKSRRARSLTRRLELNMDCRASLIYAYLLAPEIDPDEVREGQLLTILAAVSVLLLSQLFVFLVGPAASI